MNLNSDAWCDLIFKGRNQAYGAYYLRKTSFKRHVIALSIVVGLSVVFVLFALFAVRIDVSDGGSLPKPALPEQSIVEGLYYEQLIKPPVEKPLAQEKKTQAPPQIAEEETEIQQEENTQVAGKAEVVEADTTIFLGDTGENDLTIEEINEIPMLVEYTDQEVPLEFQVLRAKIVRYIYSQLKYPSVAYEQKIGGKVLSSFIVNTNGIVSDVVVVGAEYPFFENEVKRVLHTLPAWEPATKNGKPQRVKFVIPILFSL